MSKWTTNDISNQEGRVAIVTGANSGIGYETARALAEKGAEVIMACRSNERGQKAFNQIKAKNPSANVKLMQLDLSSLDSVRQFASKFREQYNHLDLLINNAGVMAIPQRQETADGFEMQFGTNHLGHFALTGLLIDMILNTPNARVVTVSSGVHYFGRIHFADLNAEKSYKPQAAYAQSKLANLLFTYELQRRFEKAGAKALAVAAHPGWTESNLQVHSPFIQFLNPFLAQQPDMGALPTLYAATAEVNGSEYFGPDGLVEMRGYPKKVNSNKRSHDEQVAARLWQVSEELTGVHYEFEIAQKATV